MTTAAHQRPAEERNEDAMACGFCLRRCAEVGYLIGGAASNICTECITDCVALLSSRITELLKAKEEGSRHD